MAKAKVFVGDKEVEQVDSFNIQGYIPTVDEIKQFILDAGSDHLLTFGGRYEGGIHLQQCPDEIAPCLVELLKHKDEIKNYLEIGSAAGGSAFIFNHFFPLERIVLIDDNKHGKHTLRKEILKDVNYRELVGRSDNGFIVNDVSKMNILFDLMVFDSDHSYQNVSRDASLYLPMLRPGGFLFLHDTVIFPDGPGRLMRELESEMELVAEYVTPEGPKCGIGLLRKGA